MGIEKRTNQDKILIFPNPSSGDYTIITNQRNKIKRVIISDLSGRKILQKEGVNSDQIEVNIENQPAGIYFAIIDVLFCCKI